MVTTSRKFSRVKILLGQWERIGKKIRGDVIRGLSDPEYQDAAIVSLLIYTTAMRPGRDGNETGGNPTYGASTLLADHVHVGKEVRLRFVGKRGVPQDVLVSDHWLAKWFRKQDATSGRKLFSVRLSVLFKYFAGLGGWTPKEFRTAVGTSLAMNLLSEADLPDGKLARKRAINEILDKVAERLGNTRAVSRSAYVDPEVLEEYR